MTEIGLNMNANPKLKHDVNSKSEHNSKPITDEAITRHDHESNMNHVKKLKLGLTWTRDCAASPFGFLSLARFRVGFSDSYISDGVYVMDGVCFKSSLNVLGVGQSMGGINGSGDIKKAWLTLLDIIPLRPILRVLHNVYSAMRILSVASVTVDKWYGYGHLKEIVVRRVDQKYTRSWRVTSQDYMERHQRHVASRCSKQAQQPRRRCHCRLGISFIDGTLTSVHDTLHHMLMNLGLGYNKAMKRRKWTATDQKRTRIMIKDINQRLLERRIMRSLEKFVGGRDYETDYRLLQRTI
ncbi:hypothetical protein Tco_0394229 [Tanacetum coccineum]